MLSSIICLGQAEDQKTLIDFNRQYKAAQLHQRNYPDSALAFIDSALMTSKKLESSYYFGKTMQLKTRSEFLLGEIDSAIIYGNQAVEILKQHPDSLDYFISEYNLGNIYLYEDDHIQALVQFKKAAKIIDQNFEAYIKIDKDKVNLNRAYCQASIGIIYQKLEDYESAELIFKKAIKISYKVEGWESETLRSVILGNLGQLYYYLGEYELAESYVIAGMEQKKILNQEASIGYNYQVLAMIAFGRGKYDLCMKYLEQSDKKFEETNNTKEIEWNAFWRAKSTIRQGKFKEGLKMLEDLEEAFLQKFTKNDQANFYELFADTWRQLGDYKKSNDYLRITLKLRKVVDVQNDKKIVKEFIHFFESEEIQLNDKIQNLRNKQEREKLELQIESDREKEIWIYTLFLVSIVCLVLIIMVISNAYRRNKKTTRDLSDSIEENQILFREVHHRVKNNFQIISSLLNLQHGIEEDERGKKVLTDAQGRIQSMSLVHEMLYRKNEVKSIHFGTYANELVAFVIKSFTENVDMIKYEVQCKDESFDLELAIPLGLILNEAITNSVKYAFNELMIGKIEIKLTKTETDCFDLIIQDNGSGIPEEYINGKKETLGIELINILSEQIGGVAKISNENGTRIEVSFKA